MEGSFLVNFHKMRNFRSLFDILFSDPGSQSFSCDKLFWEIDFNYLSILFVLFEDFLGPNFDVFLYVFWDLLYGKCCTRFQDRGP